MGLGRSNYYEEALKLPAGMGAICGGFTGLLAGIGPSLISGIAPLLLDGAISDTVISLGCGAFFGAVSGGLLGALVAIGIPELDFSK